MGGIIQFPMPIRTSPTDSALSAPVVSMFEEIEAMISIIFALKLVHFHWTGDWWWLKFRYSDQRHCDAIHQKQKLLRTALGRITAFYFERVAERYRENKPENESELSFLEVKKYEGCEADDEFLNLYFRTFRFAGCKKKLLKVANHPNRYALQTFSIWDDVKLGTDTDEEKYRVSYLYRVNG